MTQIQKNPYNGGPRGVYEKMNETRKCNASQNITNKDTTAVRRYHWEAQSDLALLRR